MHLNTRIFPTTGYARVLLFMFIRRELGGTNTACLFQFTYCGATRCGSIPIRKTVSLLANEFDVRRVLQGQVSLADVNQICVIHGAMNGYKNIKIH